MTNGGQLLAPLFIDDIARLAADCLTDPAATGQVFEVGGPETMRLRDVIAHALACGGPPPPDRPGPAPLIRLAAIPLTLLPSPPLTPDAVDFINQPATVDGSAPGAHATTAHPAGRGSGDLPRSQPPAGLHLMTVP